MAALSLHGLTKAHGHVTALQDVGLEVGDGELLTVLGPSGAGKSTLLRLIAGLDSPDGGSVQIGGEDVTHMPASRRGVAMVFQSFALLPHLNVEGNIAFGLTVRGVQAEERGRRVRTVAAGLGIEDLLERRPWELSGGERQRVALARGLIGDPDVLLLDEPLSNLDAQLRLTMRSELRRIHDETALTMVHVTHDQSEALSLGDRVAVLNAGRLVQSGVPEEVYLGPVSAWIAGFLGSPPMNLLTATASDSGVGAAGLHLALAPGADVPQSGEVLAGVRPEHLALDSGDGAVRAGRATVEFDETIGHERLLHLRAGESKLIARVPPGSRRAPGEEVELYVAPRDVHLFDAADGTALRRSDA